MTLLVQVSRSPRRSVLWLFLPTRQTSGQAPESRLAQLTPGGGVPHA